MLIDMGSGTRKENGGGGWGLEKWGRDWKEGGGGGEDFVRC